MATKSLKVGIKLRPLLPKESNQPINWKVEENGIYSINNGVQSEPYIFGEFTSIWSWFYSSLKKVFVSGTWFEFNGWWDSKFRSNLNKYIKANLKKFITCESKDNKKMIWHYQHEKWMPKPN